MEFRLLGSVEALVNGRPVDLGRRRERCVLALLLLEPGTAVPVERLAALLWDDDPPARPRAAVQTYVSRLRTRLVAAGAPREGVRLRTSGGGYLAEVDPHAVDLHRFRWLVERARNADEAARRSDLLTEALRLWRGAPLAGVATRRLREQVCGGLDELRISALELRVEADLAVARHHRIVPELTELVATHPSRERFLAALMLALYRDGRPADALHAYRQGARRMSDEFGIDPGPRLRRLHTAILRDDRPALAVGREGGTGGAAGADGAGPAVGRGGSRTGAAADRPVPAQLPADIPHFVGRSEHLLTLDRLLLADAGPVATALVVGPGGIGKTALAVHWGHRHAGRFTDGQLYADLRGFARGEPTRADELLASLLRALGVRAEDLPVDVDELSALYRSLLARRRILVVLDNARDADHVRPLLPGGPACRTIVTSRDRLDGMVAREGAGRIVVDVLSPEESVSLLGSVVSDDRVAAEPGAAAELARLTGYLPLALRIAGANLAGRPHQSVGSHVLELLHGDRLDELRVDGDERAAVGTTLGLSYQRLDERHRRLFRLLGLAPGSDFSATTAAAMTRCTVAEARRGLDLLAARHLCEQRAPGRYGFHDLLRFYAEDRARADETGPDRARAVQRLLDWYLRGAGAAADMLGVQALREPVPGASPDPYGFVDRAGALAWLEAERHNLVATVGHAADNGFPGIAATLAASLRPYFYVSGLTVEWFNVARVALPAARAAGDARLEVLAHLSLAQVTAMKGDLGFHREKGRLDRAAGHLTEALHLSERTGWLAGQAITLHNLSIVYQESGRLREACDTESRELALRRRAGMNEFTCLGGLAMISHGLGRLHEAEEHARHALALLPDSERRQRSMLMDTLSVVLNDMGRHDEALALVEEALAFSGPFDDPRLNASQTATRAAAQHDLGRHHDAAATYRLALDVASESRHHLQEARALLGLALAECVLGRHEEARARAVEARGLAETCGYRVFEGLAYNALAQIDLADGHAARAQGHCLSALTLHRDTGHRLGEGRALLLLGRAASATDAPRAVRLWRDALAVLAECGAVGDAERTRALLEGLPAVQ